MGSQRTYPPTLRVKPTYQRRSHASEPESRRRYEFQGRVRRRSSSDGLSQPHRGGADRADPVHARGRLLLEPGDEALLGGASRTGLAPDLLRPGLFLRLSRAVQPVGVPGRRAGHRPHDRAPDHRRHRESADRARSDPLDTPTDPRDAGSSDGFRCSTNPFVAFPLWAINLFVWHIPVLYDSAYGGAAVARSRTRHVPRLRHADVDAGLRPVADARTGLPPAGRWSTRASSVSRRRFSATS